MNILKKFDNLNSEKKKNVNKIKLLISQNHLIEDQWIFNVSNLT
jgi:hypothetical protein